MSLGSKRIGGISVSIALETANLSKGVGVSRSLIGGLSKYALAGATAIGGALTAAVYKLGAAHEDLNRSMSRSLSIMGNVSKELRGNMRQAAIDVAKTTNFSASQAADAYFFLASAGLSAEQSLAAMPKVAQFATAGNFDLALATDLLTDAQSALGLTVKDSAQNMQNMTRISDVLVKANALANASVEQFSIALTTQAGAALRLVGKDVEEGVAVLAAFADQGLKAEEAGTALGIVMRDLQTKALKNKEAFRSAGVSVFDASGEFRNMADVVADLERLLGGLSDAQKKQTLLSLGFSDKSVAYTQALIGTSEKIREYERQLRMAGGTTLEVADKMLTPLEKSLNQLKGSWTQLSESMGPAIEKLSVGVSKLSEMVDLMNRLNWDGVRKYLAIANPALFGELSDLNLLGNVTRGGVNQSPILNPKSIKHPSVPYVNQPSFTPSGSPPTVEGLLGGLSDAVKGLAEPRINNIRGMMEGLSQGTWMTRLMWKAATFVPEMADEKKTMRALKPSLSFAESGSVDSYRQQAAIRRQTDNIEKKQLTVQQKMEGHLSKLVGQLNFAPANISG